MFRPLLAALVLALATVLGPLAGSVVQVVPAQGSNDDGGRAEGWGPHIPAWLDPGPRGRPHAAGDGPRALPRGAARPRRRVPLPSRPGTPSTGPIPSRPDLILWGRQQTDGG